MGVMVAGCSSLSLGTRTRLESSGETPSQVRSLASLRWRVPLVPFTDLDARSRSRSTPAYDATRGTLYVGSPDRGLYAIRVTDGAVVWRFQSLGALEGTPTLHEGTLYVGSTDGALYALDARTGRMKWRFATIAEVVHAPIVLGDSVYCVNGDDTVFAVSRDRGEQQWRFRREPPGGITGGGHAGLLVHRDTLITGFSDGRVVAIHLSDGTPAWERDTSADSEAPQGAVEAHRTIDVDTTPVLLDGSVFVASYTAGLYALDPDSGSVRWRVERMLNISALAVDERFLYVTSATGGLSKVAPGDGEVQWSRSFGVPSVQRPVAASGVLYVPSAEASLWVVDPETGEPLQGLGREGVTATPLVVGRDVFFETNRGVLYAWHLTR
jgi:outer membrane protein assembly factor BamB